MAIQLLTIKIHGKNSWFHKTNFCQQKHKDVKLTSCQLFWDCVLVLWVISSRYFKTKSTRNFRWVWTIPLCWHQIWNVSSEPYKNVLLAFAILILLLSMSTLLWNLPACQLSQFPVERSFFISLHNNCLRGDTW